jgi:hypothetical protein
VTKFILRFEDGREVEVQGQQIGPNGTLSLELSDVLGCGGTDDYYVIGVVVRSTGEIILILHKV